LGIWGVKAEGGAGKLQETPHQKLRREERLQIFQEEQVPDFNPVFRRYDVRRLRCRRLP
jgi:hypothetical protein